MFGRFVLILALVWATEAEAARFAIVKPTGVVLSVVEALSASDVTPPAGGLVVEVPADSPVASDYTYDGTNFFAPAVPVSAVIQRRLDAAIDQNVAYLALNPPTQAQALAQINALTRQVNGLLRLQRNRLDAVE